MCVSRAMSPSLRLTWKISYISFMRSRYLAALTVEPLSDARILPMIFFSRLAGAEIRRAPRAEPPMMMNSATCMSTRKGPPSMANPPNTAPSTTTAPIITNIDFPLPLGIDCPASPYPEACFPMVSCVVPPVMPRGFRGVHFAGGASAWMRPRYLYYRLKTAILYTASTRSLSGHAWSGDTLASFSCPPVKPDFS